MRADIQKYITRYKISDFLQKATIQTIEKKVEREEKILFFSRGKRRINQIDWTHAFVITDRRILYMEDSTESNIVQIPVERFAAYEVKMLKTSQMGGNYIGLTINAVGQNIQFYIKYKWTNKSVMVSDLTHALEECRKQYVDEENIKYIDTRKEETPLEKLEQLHDLHEKGVINDYEYSLKKQELLDKLK